MGVLSGQCCANKNAMRWLRSAQNAHSFAWYRCVNNSAMTSYFIHGIQSMLLLLLLVVVCAWVCSMFLWSHTCVVPSNTNNVLVV